MFVFLLSTVIVSSQISTRHTQFESSVAQINSSNFDFDSIASCSVLPGNRFLLGGQQRNASGYSFLMSVFDSRTLQVLGFISFTSEVQNGNTNLYLVGQDFNASPPLLYFIVRSDAYPKVLEFEVSPDSHLVNKNVIALDHPSIHLGVPFDGIVDTNNQVLYVLALECINASESLTNLCLEKIDLKTNVIEDCKRVSGYLTGPLGFTNETYDAGDGILLYDPELSILFTLINNVTMYGTNFQVITYLPYSGQYQGGVIDIVNKKIYAWDRYNATVRKIGYSQLTLKEEHSTSLVPGESVWLADVVYDASSQLLFLHEMFGEKMYIWDVENWGLYAEFGNTQPKYRSECGLLANSATYWARFSNTTDSIRKVEFTGICAPGTVTGLCKPCTPGQYVEELNVQDNTTRYICQSCPIFSYSPNSSMSGCLPCLPNLISGQATCESCDLYETWDNISLRCVCDVGYESSNARCEPCPLNKYKASFRTQQCVFCPEHAVQMQGGVRCICDADRFENTTSEDWFSCDICPKGGVCNGSQIVAAMDGYWGANALQNSFFKCPRPEACKGGGCTSAYEPDSFLCGACASGYSVTSSLNSCAPCDAPNVWMFVLMVVIVPIVIFRLFKSNGKTNFVGFMIFINHLQFLAEVSVWPSRSEDVQPDAVKHYNAILAFLRIFQFQFLSLSSEFCVFPGSFGAQWLAQLFVPLLLLSVAILGAAFILIKRLVMKVPQAGLQSASTPEGESEIPNKQEPLRARFIRVAVIIMRFCLIGTTKLSLLILSCERVGDKLVLSAHPSLDCWEGSHLTLGIVAVVFMALYLLCTLGSVSILLLKKGNWSSDFLSGDYVESARYFELVFMGRRILVAIFSSVLGAQRNWALLLTMHVALVIQIHWKPYILADANKFEELSLFVLVGSYYFAVLAQVSPSDLVFVIVMILLVNFGLLLYCMPVILSKFRHCVWKRSEKSVFELSQK